MKENLYIDIIKKTLKNSAKYIGDDTAFIEDKGLILTQDALVEDVHFRLSTISPYDLGYKSLAVNLSDIAAAGGIPAYALISLSMPKTIDENFVQEFYKGVNFICEKYNTLVVGGDLTGAEKIYISVTMIGLSSGLNAAKRSNAQIGDIVFTTGVSGSSKAGFWLLEEGLKNKELWKNIPNNIRQKFINAHINPIPQVKLGRVIVQENQPNPTLMDTSDGLADALVKICQQSNVSMEVDYDTIPSDPDLKMITNLAKESLYKWVFFGGEDYQLVGTICEKRYKILKDEYPEITKIGKVIDCLDKPKVFINFADKTVILNTELLNKELFNHFNDSTSGD